MPLTCMRRTAGRAFQHRCAGCGESGMEAGAVVKQNHRTSSAGQLPRRAPPRSVRVCCATAWRPSRLRLPDERTTATSRYRGRARRHGGAAGKRFAAMMSGLDITMTSARTSVARASHARSWICHSNVRCGVVRVLHRGAAGAAQPLARPAASTFAPWTDRCKLIRRAVCGPWELPGHRRGHGSAPC